MSYILDAIKKSDAERGHGSIPGLQTVHSSSLDYKTDSKPIWPAIIAGLLVLNLAGLSYYFTRDNANSIGQPTVSNQSTRQTATPLTLERPNQTTVKYVPEPAQAIPRMEPLTPAGTKIEPPLDNSITQTQAPLKQDTTEVIHVSELPEHIKQRIPTLNFTGHVYSSSPLLRSIIINGSFKEEGEAINHEFTLTEITPSGAIFEYQGTLFEVSIITGWN